MTLNANSSAAVGAEPIVLVATFSSGRVTKAVSSAPLTLDVQEPWITAKLPRAQMEQGQQGTFAVELERKREFVGDVQVELGRMPKGVTYEVPTIGADTAELPIALTAAEDAAPGRHRSIFLRLIVTTPDGVVSHAVGGGELRVDRPLPPELRGDKQGTTGTNGAPR